MASMALLEGLKGNGTFFFHNLRNERPELALWLLFHRDKYVEHTPTLPHSRSPWMMTIPDDCKDISVALANTTLSTVAKTSPERMTDSNPQRQLGTVTKWLNHRGIGFITPDGQESKVGEDVLVHYSHIQQGTETAYKTLLEGSKVEFETAQDPKNSHKLIAVKVTAIGGGDCERKSRHHRDDRYVSHNRKYQNNNTNNMENNTAASISTAVSSH
jgi:cold shock protein